MLLVFIFFVYTFPLTMAVEGTSTNNTTRPGCQSECGNVTVPYPFGIGTNCSLNHSFNLTCNASFEPPKLFLGDGTIRVYSISESELRISTIVSYDCYNKGGHVNGMLSWTDLRAVPELTFLEKNMFTVVGCDDYAWVTGTDRDDFRGGCFGLCSKVPNVPYGQCSGIGCCQLSIPKGLSFYNATLYTLRNHTDVWSFNECSYGFLVEQGIFKFGGATDLATNYSDFEERIQSSMPIVVDWVIAPEGNCSTGVNECKGNSSCYDVESGGYRCKCNNGYEGNPYVHPGCQDIDECHNQGTNPCYGICTNTVGSYECTCLPGFIGDAKIRNDCKEVAKAISGMFAILSAIAGICFGIRRRKLMRLREKFFEKNGGVLLKQKIKSQGSHNGMTLFTTEQLIKATDNYSQTKIIGKGAYGVVFKGKLSDGRVVAIKKSKLVDATQAEQFINEVLILTQVIHRNVVKLLGCCLEEEVPVLVYEFISNNTLFHHIHHGLVGKNWLSWESRLRVATEVASALGYLHSEITMPIIHRDVKSSNILLDENYIAKVSDFGASRLVPLDHEQVPTLIQGTLGYLDPEYFNSSQLTEKSDVYSFGVVLAELITGKKPIGSDRCTEEKSLATYFVKSIKENRLFTIVEPKLLREGTLEQLQAVGDIGKRCLSLASSDRPTMKEVAMELEGLKKFTTHPWVQQQTCDGSRNLVLEVEQSDLYDVPLIHSTNEWETYSGITDNDIAFGVNNPR